MLYEDTTLCGISPRNGEATVIFGTTLYSGWLRDAGANLILYPIPYYDPV